MAPERDTERHVLLLTPSGNDGAVIGSLLDRASMPWRACSDVDGLIEEIAEGAGVVLLSEEALGPRRLRRLSGVLTAQPEWSDLPVVLLTLRDHGNDRLIDDLWRHVHSHVTILERPVLSATLIAALRAGLQSRRRQLQVRDELARRRRAERALREKTRELEQEDARKDLFLATLGHELRNPLASLDLDLKLLKDGSRDLADSQWRLDAHVQQLSSLVNDLLEVSRVTRGKIELRKTRVELVEVVRASLASVRSELDDRQQALRLSLPESLPLEGDPVRLGQILTNLLSNATKYTPEQGRIELAARQTGDEIRIEVQDEGRGIPPAQLTRIFEPFVQDEGGTTGGLGIGLALVKGLVELHEGSVIAESPGPGCGARFVVRLPVGLPDEILARAVPARIDSLSRPLRVLVIDDVQDIADSLALRLDRRGALTERAYTGAGGLQKAAEQQPEAVLVDIGLPDMTGYEVAAELRSRPQGHDTLLVAITGFGDDATLQKALQAGFDDRLLKPIDHDRLLQLLEERCQRSLETSVESARA